MKILNTLILLSLTTMLVGCGGPAKTSAKLEISQAFAMTNPYFGGGLIVIGEGPGGKKFSIPLTDTKQATIVLDKGLWTFAAIGWDDNLNKFEGATSCGVTQVNLQSIDATVNLTITPAGCADPAFIASVNVKPTKVNACGSFYDYASATDTFSDVTQANSLTYCTQATYPSDYKRVATHYRVFALTAQDGNVTTSFPSLCHPFNATVLSLPTMKFPLMVKMYNSATDCTNQTNEKVPFMFPNGLAVANSNFDHIFFPVNAGDSTLLLPDNLTRRGKSPFMDIIPRIMCNGADCLSDPAPTFAIRVNWWDSGSGNEQLIAKETGLTILPACQFTGATPSRYFGISDCKLENGNIYAKFHRNAFTCQETPSPFQGQDSAYVKAGKIYVLDNDPMSPFNSRITIYSLTGKQLSSINLGSSGFTKLAVDNFEHIYAANGSVTISKWTYSTGTYTGPTPLTVALAVNQFDVDDSGYIYVNSGTAGVKAYDIATLSMYSSQVVPFPIQDIRVSGGNIYVLSESAGNSEIHKAAITTPGTFTLSAFTSLAAASYTRLWVGSSMAVVSATGTVKNYSSTVANSLVTLPINSSISSPVGIIQHDGLNYIFGTGFVKVYKNNSGTFAAHDNLAAGSCDDATSTFTAGTITPPLKLQAVQDEAVFSIYETGLELLGRRTINTNDSFTYFSQLNRDDHDDGVRTGGKLGRISEMLSPKAIGGFFSDFTCTSLAAAVAAGNIGRTQTFIDPKDMSVHTYTATVSASVEPKAPYVCIDNDPTGPGCAANYQLLVTLTGYNERATIKLNCGSKAGEYESLEWETGRNHKSLTLWNTNLDNSARYESYELSDESSPANTYVSLSKVQKTAADLLWAREINADISATSINSHAQELHRINAAGADRYIMANFNMTNSAGIYGNISPNGGVYAQPGVLFDDVRDHQDFTTFATALGVNVNPQSCIPKISTSMTAPNIATSAPCATFGAIVPTMSKSTLLSLKIDNIWDAEPTNITHDLRDGTVFKLIP